MLRLLEAPRSKWVQYSWQGWPQLGAVMGDDGRNFVTQKWQFGFGSGAAKRSGKS